MKNSIQLLIISFLFIELSSCNKDKFLDTKPTTNLVVPKSLEDLQRLLEYSAIMNKSGELVEISSDDYHYYDYQTWQAIFDPWERNAHVWADDVYGGTTNNKDWLNLYIQVLYSNIVLEGLQKVEITPDNESKYKFVKGWAYFIRGFAFFNLAQCYAHVYDEKKASTELGIPLRLASAVSTISTRGSLQQTYDQIISDLNNAKDLLPNDLQTPNRNRPCKPAAFGALARVYLSMSKYTAALAAANESLSIYNELIDFNTYAGNFKNNNEEIMYYCELSNRSVAFSGTVAAPNTIVDSLLYKSYNDNDLRKTRFITLRNGRVNINKVYDGGSGYSFSGIATDEMYMIKSECLIRSGDFSGGLSLINTLLNKRFVTGSFQAYTALTKEEALSIVLAERRKELLFRGLRWQDLRRLNLEGYGISVKRLYNGVSYTLDPNSKKFVLPIPPDEIRLSGIQQNDR